jgi:hypothetical protein
MATVALMATAVAEMTTMAMIAMEPVPPRTSV